MNASVATASQIVGNQARLAQMLGVKPPTVQQWRDGTRPVPIERCVDIERLTFGAVTRRDLRPNDWWLIWPELVTAEHPVPEVAERAA